MKPAFNTQRWFGLWPGLIVALLLAVLIVGTLTAVGGASHSFSVAVTLFDPYVLQVMRFTVWQATLSTLISVILAIPVARAYARRPVFIGRGILITLMGLPVVMPVIVAVFGIVAVYGRSGLLNTVLQPAGLTIPLEIYGLTGILLAHTFFNLPLAIRLMLPAWDQVTAENWRTASTLGMSSGQLFRFVEWPAISAFLPGVVVIVFLLCFTSFAVVLTLGGGPSATTIEVAIYQALRFEFDPGQAAILALTQLFLCVCSALLLIRWLRVLTPTPGRRNDPTIRPDTATRSGKLLDFGAILVCSLFVFAPIAALVLSGLRGPLVSVILDIGLWQAAARSLGIAVTATSLAGVMAFGL
ncbi:MAG: ABC transporter permease subunit, partial [Proteobacteria bacterium]|nr:ABC transporter permease subunit [Pseudomonadota bacterium]